jgi:hypothetical protein
MEGRDRSLRRIGLFSFVCWAILVAAALRLEALERTPENHLRLATAAIGAAVALFAVLRAGTWPRLLYLLSALYFGFFAAASGWHDHWRVAAVPAEGTAETLALTLQLAWRVSANQLGSGSTGLALAQIYDLALMPLAQLVVLLHLVRSLLKGG